MPLHATVLSLLVRPVTLPHQTRINSIPHAPPSRLLVLQSPLSSSHPCHLRLSTPVSEANTQQLWVASLLLLGDEAGWRRRLGGWRGYGENPSGCGEGRGADEDAGTIRSPVPGTTMRSVSSKPSVAKRDVIGQDSVVVLWYDGEGGRMCDCRNLSGVEEVLDIRFSIGEASRNDVKKSRCKEWEWERQGERERKTERGDQITSV
ncbi:hypothetical protein BJ165DRAFT_1408581 [Panaeolus papilionaceus]|nr:hypothetical protein BJ165DRAFT_1408581 [Panaeolus papilionaceus]